MNELKTRIECKAVAQVSRKPQLGHTASGFPVCRFTVSADAGPGRNPTIMPVYIFGGPEEAKRKLALRCASLRVGELVQVTGIERQRVVGTKRGKSRRENSLLAVDVRVLGADGRPAPRAEEEREGLLRGLVVHCMKSPYEVYIGRGKDPDTFEPGEWGNRFSHRDSKFEIVRVDSAEEAVARYKAELWERLERKELLLERLADLAGKTLGCWCAPACCHGDVLAKASIWAVEKLARERAGC